jgi:hypothetical protein
VTKLVIRGHFMTSLPASVGDMRSLRVGRGRLRSWEWVGPEAGGPAAADPAGSRDGAGLPLPSQSPRPPAETHPSPCSTLKPPNPEASNFPTPETPHTPTPRAAPGRERRHAGLRPPGARPPLRPEGAGPRPQRAEGLPAPAMRADGAHGGRPGLGLGLGLRPRRRALGRLLCFGCAGLGAASGAQAPHLGASAAALCPWHGRVTCPRHGLASLSGHPSVTYPPSSPPIRPST